MYLFMIRLFNKYIEIDVNKVIVFKLHNFVILILKKKLQYLIIKIK